MTQTAFASFSIFLSHNGLVLCYISSPSKISLNQPYSSLRSCLRKHKTSPRLHALAREIKQLLSGQDSAPELLAKAFLSGEFPENTDLLPLASAYFNVGELA